MSKVRLLFLQIASRIYGSVVAFRNYCYDRGWLKTYTCGLPVICVGNLTAGGNSKTPLVQYLCKQLLNRSYKPVVLMRGYGGSVTGPYLVQSGDSIPRVSDEALLLANSKEFPVVIAADRVAGANFIESNKLGNVIVMDDGLQHRRLKRDLNIVVVNATTADDLEEFVEGELIPFGRFREDRSAGLQRASIIVFVNRSLRGNIGDLPGQLLSSLPDHLKVFRGKFISTGIDSIDAKDQKIVAFCSIANPQGFFTSLEELGYKLCGRIVFPDHYHFKWSDIKELQARYPDIPLVCTAKDFVKLDASWGRIHVLHTELDIQPEDAFLAQAFKAIAHCK